MQQIVALPYFPSIQQKMSTLHYRANILHHLKLYTIMQTPYKRENAHCKMYVDPKHLSIYATQHEKNSAL